MNFARVLMDRDSVQLTQLNVYDLDALEEEFLKENLDFIFTVREPSKKKFTHIKLLGTQQTETVNKSSKYRVMSPFEYGSQKKKSKSAKTLISNSLVIRRQWLEKIGGQGYLPGELQERVSRGGGHDVLLIGSETVPEKVWTDVLAIEP
jgi:hypothetical protein